MRERDGAGHSLGAGPRSTCGSSVGGVANGGLWGFFGVGGGSIGEEVSIGSGGGVICRPKEAI